MLRAVKPHKITKGEKHTDFKMNSEWHYISQQYLPSGVSTRLILTAVTESPASSTVEQGLIESNTLPSVVTDKSH